MILSEKLCDLVSRGKCIGCSLRARLPIQCAILRPLIQFLCPCLQCIQPRLCPRRNIFATDDPVLGLTSGRIGKLLARHFLLALLQSKLLGATVRVGKILQASLRTFAGRTEEIRIAACRHARAT